MYGALKGKEEEKRSIASAMELRATKSRGHKRREPELEGWEDKYGLTIAGEDIKGFVVLISDYDPLDRGEMEAKLRLTALDLAETAEERKFVQDASNIEVHDFVRARRMERAEKNGLVRMLL